MTDDLDIRMAQIIAQMSVISEAGASRLGDVVHGGEPSNAPKGPRVGLADWHREAWRRARTVEKRQAALEAAEKDLLNARVSPGEATRYQPGTLDQRQAIAFSVGSAKVVARRFNCTERHVYKMRQIEKDRMPEDR